MTRQILLGLVAALRLRYRQAPKAQKKLILDEFCATTGYHRGSYYALLHRLGLSVQRPVKVYRSRSEAAVQAFKGVLEKNG